MKAAIKIEAIGENTFKEFDFWNGLLDIYADGFSNIIGLPKRNYWLAEITGFHPQYNYNRTFLKSRKDYRKSNQKGSRGIHLWYTLKSGRLYEINRPISWKRDERFFFTVSDTGEIQKLTKERANEWVKNISE